ARCYVALPEAGWDLGFSHGGLQWVMSAYLLFFGGLLLLGGRCADLLGRRRVFMAGVGLFVCASLLCGLAWSPAALTGARVVQGVSAAIMAPTALSILLTVFPDGPERNRALGIWGGIGGVGATAGLLLGGPVTAAFGWRGVFFINIPAGLAVLAFSRQLLPESSDTGCARCFDIAGAAAVTTALVLLIYGISGAPTAGWAGTRTIAPLGTSAVLFGLFGLIEARSRAPLVPVRIFRARALVGGNLVLLAAGMSVDGTLLIVTLYAQEVLGYSAVQFGLMTAVMTATSAAGAYTAQAVVTRAGVRRVGAAGMTLVGAACLVLARVPANGRYWPELRVCARPARRAHGCRRAGVRAGGRPCRQLVQHRQRARDRHLVHRCRGPGGPRSRARRDDGGLPGGLRRCGRHRPARRRAGR